MARIKADLCVIGAGSGGLSVAAGAAQMGAKVVLLESRLMGGDCLNFGCVPSKALIASARQAHIMAHGAPLGIAGVAPQVDYAAAMDHVHRVIKAIAPIDSQERFEGLGVRVIREVGRFISPSEVQAGDDVIKARRFVIATGSAPFIPPIPGLDGVKVLTNETIFDLRARPEHLVILGGGPIGMEMAQAHIRLGSRVTVIEADRILSQEDPELATLLAERLRIEGVTILEGAKAERVSGAGGITVHTGKGEITGSHLLMAVGRAANVAGLDLEKGGIAFTEKGVSVGPDLRSTSNRRVYAVGDVAGGPQFTHVAGYHAGLVLRAILFNLPVRVRTDHIPHAIYTDPELAQVGLTEAQARARYGRRLEVVRTDFSENDRARTQGRTAGLAKIMIVGGRPVGASILGAGAGDLIGIWALAVASNLRVSAIANTVLPYPTLGEINKRAASTYFSPRLFGSPWVKRAVRLVQKLVP